MASVTGTTCSSSLLLLSTSEPKPSYKQSQPFTCKASGFQSSESKAFITSPPSEAEYHREKKQKFNYRRASPSFRWPDIEYSQANEENPDNFPQSLPYIEKFSTQDISNGTVGSYEKSSGERKSKEEVTSDIARAVCALKEGELVGEVLEKSFGKLEAIEHCCLLRQIGKKQWKRALEVYEWLSLKNFHVSEARSMLATILGVLGKAKQPSFADQVFQNSHPFLRNWTIVYNAIMGVHARLGLCDRVQELIDLMRSNGCEPDNCTFNILINARLKSGRMKRGTAIEFLKEIRSWGREPDLVAYNTLISACARNSNAVEAEEIFREMEAKGLSPDTVTFNALLLSFSRNGRLDQVQRILQQMKDIGLSPNMISYNTVIRSYGVNGLHKEALDLFHEMKRLGHEPDVMTFSILIDFLGKAELIEEAEAIFTEMKELGVEPTLEIFSAFICSYAKAGRLKEAEKTYDLMLSTGVAPDLLVNSVTLDVFMKAKKLEKGMQLYRKMVDQKMIPDRGLYVSMIRTLNKEGKSKEIGELVFGMGQYGIDPHETCGVLVKAECHEKAAEVLESAVSDGYLPSHESVLSIFSAYSSSKKFSEACSFVNLFTDPKISIAIRQELVVMLSKAKQIETAVKEFKKLRDCSPKIDNFVYESLLEACEQTGMSSEASQLYLDMKSSALQLTPRCYRSLALVYCKMGLPATAHSLLDFAAKSGSGTGNGTSIHVALIQAYGKQGMWQKAEKYFAELHVTDKVADGKVWGALMSAYAKSGCYEQAKAAFDQMLKDGLSPTVKTINDLVKACINGDAMGQIYALLEDIQKVGFKISRSTILLILNGFAKAGDVFEVKRIYNNMKVAGYAPNMQAYRIVICALCNSKRVKSVNALLHEMKIGGLKPDFSIYKAMIKMYMKINNPQKALEICKGMKADGFSPDNGTYDILISMYSRLLMPEEGSRILTQMRIHGHFPTLDSCRELLSACCRKQLWDESEKLFKQMQSSCKLDRPAYHTMLNAYTHRGKHKKAQSVVAEMKNSGIIPNLATMRILKKSSKIAGEPQRSEALFKKLTASGLSLGVAQYTMVVDAYLNIGDYTTAIGKLLKMKNDGIEPDCRTWTCVIGAASICKHTNEAVGLLNALHDTGFSLPIRLLTETYKNMISEIESLFERLKGAEEEIVFGFINALEDLLWAFEQRATAACIFHMAIQRDIYSPDIFCDLTMPRRVPAWQHCTQADPTNSDALKCNYCQVTYHGGVNRMKYHIS